MNLGQTQEICEPVQHADDPIEHLLGLEPLKTWSLIATIFGDIAGEDISGGQIRALLGPLGIKPEAMRVALHRLKADGWIATRRVGREAVYSLSKSARRETESARRDVYGTTVKHPDGWHIMLVPDAEAIPQGLAIGKETIVVPRQTIGSLDGSMKLEFSGDALPAWLEHALVPATLLRNAAALSMILDRIQHSDEPVSEASRNTLRILTLHHWRRLALRDGTWAHIGLLPGGSIAQCHQMVTRYLATTAPISTSIE